MSTLNAAAIAALAASAPRPRNAFIDGKSVPALSGATFATINPATGETLAEIAACDAPDIHRAVAAARKAFEDGVWSQRPAGERKAVLKRLATLIDENRD